MSEAETPKTKKTRSPAKSFAEKIGEMAEAKRKQVAKLKERRIAAQKAFDEADVAYDEAVEELRKLEAATGAAS